MAAAAPPQSAEGHARPGGVMRALRHRNFRIFFVGQGFSLVGTWMQLMAQSWLIYRLTGSSVLLGAMGFTQQIWLLLLSPLAGHVADRYRRHHIIIITQAVLMTLAFSLGALTLTGAVRVWHIFVFAALYGTTFAFDAAARQSFVVYMVSREDLPNAIALHSSMNAGARTIGPAIAGVILARIGEGGCFVGNGISYLAVLAGLLMITVVETRRKVKGSPLSSILEGWRYVAATRPLRAVMLLLVLVNLCLMPYTVLMPIFADRILHGGVRGMGMLLASAGAGALTGVLLLARRRGTKGLTRWVMVSAIGMGVWMIAFSLSRSFYLSMALLYPLGGFWLACQSGINTLVQSMVPDRLRGRVMSVFVMGSLGMHPFGALFAGFLGQHLGAPMAVAISGVVCLAGALWFCLRLPRFGPGLRELLRTQAEAHALADGEAQPAH